MIAAKLYRHSANAKLGGIPASITSRDSCPKGCALRGNGCYAENGPLSWAWDKVRGSWAAFCADVASLPRRQLWRHNQAGDLPGRGGKIDRVKLAQLVQANTGRHGFTFTHYRPDERNADPIRDANAKGFTINLSADSLADADAFAALGVGPVVVVLPKDAPAHSRTPEGRHVIVCPEQTSGVPCSLCALCAKPFRKAIVGFRAHGSRANTVNRRLKVIQ